MIQALSECDELLAQGWGDTPRNLIPADWRTRKGPDWVTGEVYGKLLKDNDVKFSKKDFKPACPLAAATLSNELSRVEQHAAAMRLSPRIERRGRPKGRKDSKPRRSPARGTYYAHKENLDRHAAWMIKQFGGSVL